jgi:hypothetical protein
VEARCFALIAADAQRLVDDQTLVAPDPCDIKTNDLPAAGRACMCANCSSCSRCDCSCCLSSGSSLSLRTNIAGQAHGFRGHVARGDGAGRLSEVSPKSTMPAALSDAVSLPAGARDKVTEPRPTR